MAVAKVIGGGAEENDGSVRGRAWFLAKHSFISISFSIVSPKEPFSFIRIAQPKGGGPDDRANILWAGQIEITD